MERFGPFDAIESEPANWLQSHTDQTLVDKDLQFTKYLNSEVSLALEGCVAGSQQKIDNETETKAQALQLTHTTGWQSRN